MNFMFFAMCNRLQTVCEQSAIIFGSRKGVQQFVNRVQQIVIAATCKGGSQATKHPVVEHKGTSDDLVGFLASLVEAKSLRAV